SRDKCPVLSLIYRVEQALVSVISQHYPHVLFTYELCVGEPQRLGCNDGSPVRTAIGSLKDDRIRTIYRPLVIEARGNKPNFVSHEFHARKANVVNSSATNL